LVRNCAFLDDPNKPVHWSAVGDGATAELEKSGPSLARPYALKVRGAVANDGYWGFPVRPSTPSPNCVSLNPVTVPKRDAPRQATGSTPMGCSGHHVANPIRRDLKQALLGRKP
jgi:hypothetical protein